jgi:hypothetical protein
MLLAAAGFAEHESSTSPIVAIVVHPTLTDGFSRLEDCNLRPRTATLQPLPRLKTGTFGVATALVLMVLALHRHFY